MIVEASLQGHRVFATQSANPQGDALDNEAVHGKPEKTTDDDDNDDNVLVMDETGAFVAVKNEVHDTVCTQPIHLPLLPKKLPRIQNGPCILKEKRYAHFFIHTFPSI